MPSPTPNAASPNGARGFELRTVNPEPGTLNPEPGRDTPMTATYIRVLVLEAAILVLLWVFGRAFS
jgi:hypothetical protein